MVNFLSSVGGGLRGKGYYVVANGGVSGDNDGSLTSSWWKSIAPYVNGLGIEYFEEGPDKVLFYNDLGRLARLLQQLAQHRRHRPEPRQGLHRRRPRHRHRHEQDELRQGRLPAEVERRPAAPTTGCRPTPPTPGTPPGRPRSAAPAAPCTRSAPAGAATTAAAP